MRIKPNSSLVRFWLLLVYIVLGVPLSYYFFFLYSGLPSDEEMVEHFYEHRSEFEKLVERYRSFEPDETRIYDNWRFQGDTPELMRKAQVVRITRTISLWPPFPDPYSKSAEDKLHEVYLIEPYFFNRNAILDISLLPEERYRRHGFSSYYPLVWKRVVFFPGVPRIEGNKLIFPLDKYNRPIKKSLNILSFDGVDRCAYREIEGQWFLKICYGG